MSLSSHIFHAGYTLPAFIADIPETCGVSETDLQQVLKRLTYFSLEDTQDVPNVFQDTPHSPLHSLLRVLYNQLLRGEPAFIPYDIEQLLAQKLGCLQPANIQGNLGFRVNPELRQACWYALHPIDPRINRKTERRDYQQSWERLDSRAEEGFLFHEIPASLFDGQGDFLIQLIQPQRSLGNMIDDPDVRKAMQQNFKEQRADFVMEFPYGSQEGVRGICLEVDGPQHRADAQKHHDQQRDTATQASGWHSTFRFPTGGFGSAGHQQRFSQIQSLLEQHPAIHIYQQNYHQLPDINALQLALSPFGIARIQFALLRAMLAGQLSLDQPAWCIGVVEHDLPCAYLAVEQLQAAFAQLATLAGVDVRLPKVQMDVFVSPEFWLTELNQGRKLRLADELQGMNAGHYDLFIEISLLSTPHFSPPTALRLGRHGLRIHNAFHSGDQQPFLSGPRIPYQALWDNETSTEREEPRDALRFFLRNIFRKEDFRPGQLRILNLALQNQHVIGLLPTGGGKSLTYQIAGLMQPGLTIVIDPIKSLMKDQVDSLARMGISRTVYINSSLDGPAKRQATSHMQTGNALFCFISPERMLISSFRNLLAEMSKKGHYFAYGVVDEAHCVSEWGHDFRTPYLALGRNLLRFCKAYGGAKLTLFGLTATASYDVLADVQRELSGKRPGETYGDEVPDGHIVQYHTTNRYELQYAVEEVLLTDAEVNKMIKKDDAGLLDDGEEVGFDIIPAGNVEARNFSKNLKRSLGIKKQYAIVEWLRRAPEQLRYFATDADQVVTDELIRIVSEGSQGALPTVEEVATKIALPPGSLENFWKQNGSHAALVFAPHRSWFFGVTDKYSRPTRNAGIADHLETMDSRLHIGTYLGAPQDEDGTTTFMGGRTSQVDKDNERHQTLFLRNELDVMVATKAFGMGIDKPNIRLTIHDTYPGSIESFVQEAGRAGRDQKLALSVLLFNEQVFPVPGLDEPIELDFDLQRFFYDNSFPGPKKEKRAIHELLTNIILPPLPRSILLARKLAGRLDMEEDETSLRLRYSTDFDALWLNDSAGNTYGYVRPHRQDFRLSRITVSTQVATEFLQELLMVTKDENISAIPPANLNAWLGERQEGGTCPGIETQLADMEPDEERSLVIPFSNGLSKEDPRYRNKAATDKAIYRLFLTGVLDDYTIDYVGHSYTVTFSKKPDSAYREHLKHYIDKFYPPRKVAEILDQISQRKGNTEIQRIFNYLIEFLYNEIAKKRYESIRVMKDLCKLGLKEGNIGMKTFIHLYFNSKYARQGYSLDLVAEVAARYETLQERETGSGTYNCSLRDWTDRGRLSQPEWIFDFIRLMDDDYTGATLDNLKHLRGACTLLLISSPDNATLRLLRAFALLVLADRQTPSQRILPPIAEDLAAGFRALARELPSRRSFGEWLKRYRSTLAEKTATDLTATFDELLNEALFRMHADWTQEFAETLHEQLSPLTQ
ncbi:MAG: DEAD/DEAH box helicase [Bacteroidia bacterium]|nr:DEAD/DEAH box helicase [Bacteroidia bacterium]